MSESAKVVQPGPPPARSRLRHTALVLIDLIDMPGFNPATQRDRGDWSLRDVTAGTVTTHPRDKVRCIDHGAMNCVNPERTIWRCLMCGRAAYAPRVEEVVRPVTDLVEFLRDRVDEDEAVAQAAIGEPFTSTGFDRQPFPTGTRVVPDGRWSARSEHEADNRYIEGLDILIYDEGGHDEHQAAHIARWDPARVLAEVAAKRAMIDALQGYEPSDQWHDIADMGKRENNAAGTLRRMAQVYADHPDFAPAWRLTPE